MIMGEIPGRNPPDLSGITIMELAPLAGTRCFRVTGASTGDEAVDALDAMVKGCGRSEIVDYMVFVADGVPSVWFVDVSPEPTPAPPLPPEQEAMLLVGEYPICSTCWAQGTKDRLLMGCREGRCSEGLRVCAIREIRAQLRMLRAVNKPLREPCKYAGMKECPSCMFVAGCRDKPPWVGGQGMPTPPGYTGGPTPANPKPPCGGTAVEPPTISGQGTPSPAYLKHTLDAVASIADSFREQVGSSPLQNVALRHILAKLERVPCMSEDCDGPEDGEPATKKNSAATRCHRCAAVRLAKRVVDSG